MDANKASTQAMMYKDIHLNLREEYRLHLKYVSMLEHFSDLKLHWDHAFYKTVIRPKIAVVEEEKPEPRGLESFGDNVH